MWEQSFTFCFEMIIFFFLVNDLCGYLDVSLDKEQI